MFSIILLFLFALTIQVFTFAKENEILIPVSFSSNQKKYSIPIESKSILDVFEKYELDTHLEIVLLGDFHSDALQYLQTSLDQLSKLSYSGSSLKYTHEKILFHISTAKSLENSIISLLEESSNLSSDKVNNEKQICEIFDNYHSKVTATRTLFVTNFTNPLFSFTYISSSGYAFLDLFQDNSPSYNNREKKSRYEKLGDIKPIIVQHDTLPSPILTAYKSNKVNQYYDLAVLIYRSVEQLFPLPLPNQNVFNINHVHNMESKLLSMKMPSLPPPVATEVHIQLITLCGYPLKQCQPDVISTSVLESLSRESFLDSTLLSSSLTRLKITQSSSLLSISDSVPLMSAVLASFQRHSTFAFLLDNNKPSNVQQNDKNSQQKKYKNNNILYLSPDELLSSLSHSPEVIKILEEILLKRSKDLFLLPVVSVLIPDDWDVLLSSDVKGKGKELNNDFDENRFCQRGLYEYAPNSTLYGSTISCHPFHLSSKEGRNFNPKGKRKSYQKLMKSDRLMKNNSLSNDNEIDEEKKERSESISNVGSRVGLDSAIVVVRTSGESASTTLLPGLVRSFFSSTRLLAKGDRLHRDASYLTSELYNVIVQVVWDFPPPHVYYSPSSQQIVTDYFWFESLAWGMVDSMNENHINVNNNNFHFDKNILNNQLQRRKNFRQDSLFPRMRLFQVVDELLVRAVRATILLESLDGFVFTKSNEISLVEINKLKQKKKYYRDKNVQNSKEIAETTNLFITELEKFLESMNKLAIAFSHGDYEDGLDTARSAEVSIIKIENLLHNSELREQKKQELVFLDSDGQPRINDMIVSCKTVSDTWNYDADEEIEDEAYANSYHGRIVNFLSSSTVDHVAIFLGLLLGTGSMCLYVYFKSNGMSGKRKYYRA